ncbi:O-antigen ligase domain-containing protein, partial [Pseudomonas aeruginosa]
TVIHYVVSPNWHDQQRIFQLLLLSGSSLFFFLYFPSSLIRRKVFAALLLSLGLGVFSSFLSDNSCWAL